ncbi:MAG: magnesium-translocating P-type ATPase [Ignavibacteria bacterium]|nr:magnesium-translocating P-type ATPase [Ignavibacteria bacterium]
MKRVKNKTANFALFKNEADEYRLKRLREIAISNDKSCLRILESGLQGLSQQKVIERRAQYGPNEIASEKAPTWYKQLINAFITPFNGVLILIAIVAFITDSFLDPTEHDIKTIMVISVMVLFSSLLRFWQEYRSNKAADHLKNMIKTTATVIRENADEEEIDIQELVPGDIVLLSAGDMIPADCRVLRSKDLFVGQAVLTGESVPVEKREDAVYEAFDRSMMDLDNICFMGTNVVSGSSLAIVVATGNQTYFGSISKSITGTRPTTSFDKGVKSVSWLLIRFMVIMVPLVFLINGFTKGSWLEALLFAVAVAVGLTPEMLPMIVTTNLAKGAMNMSKRKVIVKRLNAIQNIGAMDIFCTDKTGTLTLDKIVLTIHDNVYGEADDEVLKWAYLNSTHQTGLKNLMDTAILEHAEVEHYLRVKEDYLKVDEIPFDFQRRRMSVILKQKNGKHLLICKGAVEEVLSLCSHAFDPGEDRQLHIENDTVLPMDDEIWKSVMQTCKRLNEDGLRVLLIAIKEYDEKPLTYSVADERNMILTGLIGFLDPPKPSSALAIKSLNKLGVNVKVLTGDNEIITKKICREVGIQVDNVMLGNELESVTDEELKNRIEDISIFAKLSPNQKSRVINVLQAKGHTVGYMGDGINDASALRDADVGISVDTAVDIAKESADIILLEKDLMVLRKGVIYGRRTFGNIIKYIKMAASSNYGNMFSMLGASAFLPFLPMLPIQILVQNLLYDISQVSIPWDTMDKEYIEKPRKWDTQGIGKFMLFIGPISSIFDYATFALLFFVFEANSPRHQSLFQSGWFVEGLLSQTLIVHMIRTRKIPFIQSWATAPVIVGTSLVMAAAIFIPFSPFSAALKMQPLPLFYFPWLIGILFCYCLLTQLIKTLFIKRYSQWL